MKEILIALASGGICAAVCGFIQFLIARADSRKDDLNGVREELASVREELVKVKKDSTRTQLLILMRENNPDDKMEILRVAEYYFVELRANFYMTPKFMRWLRDNDITIPGWWEGGSQK